MRGVIFGLSGPILTKAEQMLIEEHKPHGIILFSRNCQERQQIIALNKSIKNISPETKIFIDQEGGRVRRIKPPIGEKDFPSMEVFDKLYDENPDKAIEACEQNFFELMTDLKGLGVDVTCAPVCDIRYKGASDVIGDRAFGSSVGKVVALAKAALRGIQKAGGEGVIKHIPGHGRALTDSHHELPFVSTSLEELNKTDFAVFRELAPLCPYAMTAHVVYEALDPENSATLSKKVIDYIRTEIGFTGLIMTDALEMKALSEVPIKDRAVLCYEAGCDIALYCTGEMYGIKDIYTALEEMSNLS
jgi:beta-glucosidase-like glycosyl hydrolase